MDFTDPYQRRAFFDVHNGLPREGPGDHESTAQALEIARRISPCTQVLDIACGPGMQTMDLARLLPGAEIAALDRHEPFLAEVERRAAHDGHAGRVHVTCGDMRSLPFPADAFDLIWCEGAAYIMGVANALEKWKQHLTPNGVLALTEAIWLRPNPPDPVRQTWEEYPAMTDIRGCSHLIESHGYTLLCDFVLPDSAWVTDYYAPMEKRIEALSAKYVDDPAGSTVLQECQDEIRLYREYGSYYGYAFFVMTPGRRSCN